MSRPPSSQMDFRNATMVLADGSLLTIPEGVVTFTEFRGPSIHHLPSTYPLTYNGHSSGGGGQFIVNQPDDIEVEFTLTPRNVHGGQPFTKTRGPNLTVTLPKTDMDVMVGALVSSIVSELEEREGLSIEDRPDRDDIIDTLIELVTTELRDIT